MKLQNVQDAVGKTIARVEEWESDEQSAGVTFVFEDGDTLTLMAGGDYDGYGYMLVEDSPPPRVQLGQGFQRVSDGDVCQIASAAGSWAYMTDLQRIPVDTLCNPALFLLVHEEPVG